MAVAATSLLGVAGCGRLAPALPAGSAQVQAFPETGDPGRPDGGAGNSLVPSGTPGAFDTGSAPGSSTAPGSATPSIPAPGVRVSSGVQSINADLGVEVYWHTIGDPASVDKQAARILDYVVGLGANAVAVTFPIFTDGAKPTRAYGTPDATPDPTALGRVVAASKARGLRVTVRPLIDEADIISSGGWRGSLQPADVNSWFASYRALLGPYFTMARAQRADEFVVGTELNSLIDADAQWRGVMADGTAKYGGELTYASNWDSWAHDQVPSAVPDVGVDAYPPLKLPDTASVDQLSAAWTAWLRHRSGATLEKTAIQELGIPAQAGAYTKPNSWGSASAAIKPQIQINWFAAACQSARALHLRGLYFWMVDSNAVPDHAQNDPSGSFIGRGDSAIKSCFAEPWSHS
ncbi:glycoside hydrolase family 113 [Catenulispora rubra]|uniref:glycoside hydrolase family 113 n=1 Tax=Catenulispora rubra TaxID=280293 RepID=UPI0018922F97|nr:hypothetical protein [Catenulispora rubra]